MLTTQTVNTQNPIQEKDTAEDIKIKTGNFCYKCLQPKNPECEICNGICKNESALILFALQSPNAKLE